MRGGKKMLMRVRTRRESIAVRRGEGGSGGSGMRVGAL